MDNKEKTFSPKPPNFQSDIVFFFLLQCHILNTDYNVSHDIPRKCVIYIDFLIIYLPTYIKSYYFKNMSRNVF